ncbi:SNF2-related protein [Ferrimicrobium sp.]|uniref:SNF2-related protein n=1 Tax=Ferrimicrobium sp. TaxID=2926050 RepID=UPI002626656C|nr:SNF2-related protein [Ferrimicrobium sp.]
MNTITFHGSKCHIVFGWPPPPEKDEVKQLGAKWNPRDKVWIASITYELAEWLRQHGVEIPADVVVPDPPVPELPEGESMEEILAESWATDADIEIPAPNGVDYRPFQKAGIAWALKRPGALIGDDMGLGKAQPVTEPVLTPTGWQPIGNLRVGDEVIGSDGYPTRVLGVYPQKDRRVVRITMSDGSWTRCTPDHLWAVQRVQTRHAQWRTMSTSEIMDKGLIDKWRNRTWRIPMVQPVQYSPTKCPIDPYVFGVILGDASINSKGHVCLCTDLKTIEKLAVPGTIGYHKSSGIAYLNTTALADDLKQLGVAGCRAHEKFVPAVYLHGTVDDRLALLQGLLDTDGYAMPDGGAEFSSTSPLLVNAVAEIVESLGGVARGRRKSASAYTYGSERKTGKPAERINIKLPPPLAPFRLARKLDTYVVPTKYPPTRLIASITPELDEDTVCIRVEADDQLYVTRDYIVTHNTIQALGVVNADPDVGSALIVCPLSVALNWRNEAAKWLAREMSVGVATSKEFPETDIVIAHWGILTKHTDALRMRDWDLIALDEAHYAKNPRAKRTQAIFGSRSGDKALTAKHRLALTGTPIPNRPIELYPLLNWLAPRQFDNWFNYATQYCAAYKTRYGWDVNGASNLDELQEKLRTIMIRRLKKDVLTELPPKTRQVILLDADTPELRAVLHSEETAKTVTEVAVTRARIDVELAKAQSPEEYKKAVASLHEAQGVAFTQISKVRHETALAKIPQVLVHVKDILDNEGQKVIIFAHHRDVIDRLREGLEAGDSDAPGVETVSIMGGDAPEERQAAIASFQNDPATRVFLGSIGAAKEGITLTAADISIFAELDWVPGNLSQAEDRCYRIGQRNSVLVQHLLVDGSIDALMADTILAKQAVLDEALDQRHEGTVTTLPDRAPVGNPNSSLIFAQVENGNTWEAKGEGETRSPVEDANDAATSGLPLSEVAKRAEWITPDEIQMVHKGLRLLSGMDWDHAQEVNGIGFSKIDVGIGHDLAGRDTLSPKQAALGAKLTNKYRRQLPEECSRVWNDLKDRMVQASEIAKEVEDGDKGLEVPVQLGFGLRKGLR